MRLGPSLSGFSEAMIRTDLKVSHRSDRVHDRQCKQCHRRQHMKEYPSVKQAMQGPLAKDRSILGANPLQVEDCRTKIWGNGLRVGLENTISGFFGGWFQIRDFASE